MFGSRRDLAQQVADFFLYRMISFVYEKRRLRSESLALSLE